MKTLLTLALLSFSTLAFSKSAIEIKNPTIRLTPPGSTTTAMFVELVNNSDKDLSVISVKGDFAQEFELHNMEMNEGKMSMRKIDSILLKKKSTTTLKSGGLHIMIFNLLRPLKENEEVEVGLVLDNKETIKTKALVKAVTAHH